MFDLLTAVTAGGPIAIAAVAGIFTLNERRRTARAAYAAVHQDLTTGEVAQARDLVARTMFARKYRFGRAERALLIKGYFALYWSIERAHNVMQLHRAWAIRWFRWRNRESWLSKRSVERDAQDFMTWNLNEIVQNVVEFRRRFREPLNLHDQDAWASLAARLQRFQPELYEANRVAFESQEPGDR